MHDEWRKPPIIPRHDEPKAVAKLISAMKEVASRLRLPEQKLVGSPIMDGLKHPDFDGNVLAFPSRGSMQLHNLPLRVDVFPRDSVQRRHRVYSFRHDGVVIVEEERNPYRESSEGPELKEETRVAGWPQGASHLFLYAANVLRQSAKWERDLADHLEKLST